MPSVSKKQQKFMGIVRAIQKGEADPSDFNKDAQDAAKKMKKSSVKKYAKTKHKGLPNKKVNEAQVTKSIMTNPNNRKLYFTLVDGNDVKLIDAKTWLKSSLKDVSSTVNQDKVIKSIVRKQKQFNKKVEWNQWKSKNKPSFVEQMKWLMDNGFVKNVNKGGIKESLTPAEVKKERELFKKTGELPPRLQKVVDDYENERKAFHKKMKKKFKGNVKGDWVDVVVPGLEWMSKLGESAQRDYKAEYKKFQSSPKAKKYRAELNKYNRQKGTYGNGDGKDASHKGGKIVGFESQSKNRGRAEKSRLKKEINDYVGSIVNEVVKESTYSPQTLLQIAKQIREADGSVNEIKVWDVNEACWKGYEKKGMKKMFGKMYPNCVKKKKSESVNEQSKVIKSIDNLAKKNKYGTVTGTQMNGKTANMVMKIYNHPKMKSRQKDLDKFTSDELVNLTISRDIIRILGLKESINEFKTIYNKNKAAMKIRSLQRDKAAKVYKVDKKRTKYQGKDLIVYNLFTKNKAHSTNQNPYGLDMMKGAYLIPVEENIKKDSGLDHNEVMTKFISDAMKKAGIKIIKVDMTKKGRFGAPEGDEWYGAFFTVRSSNMTDMPGQGKVKRSSAVLPIYVDKKGNLDLRVAPKKFIIGKYPNMNQVVKTLKAFKKSDLEESINERAWTPAQEKAVKELDKKFYKLIGKKGIEPYTYEASQMWTSGGFRKEMRKIFGKDVKESVNENISDSQKFKIYNSLKKGDIVSIKYDSTIAKGSKFHPFLVTKGKTKLMKGKIERIIMVPAGGSKAKRYLYNRNGRISLALGDMAAVIVDMKKGEVNEGSCGYGVDGKLGEEPAGPHLMKKIKKIKKKKKDVNEARLDPKQLLQQLGGNKFIAMTGAKNLAVDRAKNTLHMKIGRNAKGVSHLRIKLTGADLYDMEFLQVRAGNVKVKAKEKGVYNDQLQKMFTKHTGMYTSL